VPHDVAPNSELRELLAGQHIALVRGDAKETVVSVSCSKHETDPGANRFMIVFFVHSPPGSGMRSASPGPSSAYQSVRPARAGWFGMRFAGPGSRSADQTEEGGRGRIRWAP
jgi:hypothetical protein